MGVEVMELIGQDVGVRDEIERCSTKSLLHFDIVIAKSVFSCDFITLREMVDSLEFIEAFV